ncbi:MAG: F0F1 ATP synthase subunit alpha [Clostridiaceae bacterium]|nr:F0F1 ATP synthase subunit alpha [Clostridiaceae bacterium]
MKKLLVKSSVALTAAQKKKLESGIRERELSFKYVVEPIIGGIQIYDGERILDTSIATDLSKMKKHIDDFIFSLGEGVAVKDIPSLIKEKSAQFKDKEHDFEICGRVTSAADGVVRIEGLSSCKYGELVLVGNAGFALAMNLEENGIGAMLLGGTSSVSYGDIAYTTGKILEVPVGDEMLGRVIDPLGNPLDGRAPLKSLKTRRMEYPAPAIIDRAKVNQPLETGILAVDAMVPIGKGQRELLIGDRQTGKTAIALDAIINQRGKNVICVYVAIGQRSAAVKNLVKTLDEQGAMSYTTVVLSTASDTAPLKYIAPYTGAAIAENFMYAGRDVLIVYDDLSKHAEAYRTISLLLKRPAGREAFPGDVFYIHSKLLERAAKLADKLGGGSMTALPIIETQAGDISAYIPTNVISITDGQIYLSKELFNAGQRPAINVGLSVSRVGGSAQTKLMRKLSSKMRLEIAHYRELVVFAQFGSSLDPATRETIENGVRMEEAIRQPEGVPLDMLREEIYLFAIVNKALKKIPRGGVLKFLDAYYNYITATNPTIMKIIKETGDLDEDNAEILRHATEDFTAHYTMPDAE